MSEERKALAAAAWQRVEQLADEVIKWSAYVRQCEQAGVDSAVLHQEFQAKMEAFKRRNFHQKRMYIENFMGQSNFRGWRNFPVQ